MGKDIENLLREKGIKISAIRILVGKVLQQSTMPLSALEIEQALATVDRSSITRALSLFTSKGLVHSIDDGSGATKYELCHAYENDSHSDLHPHFHCMGCGATFCLNDTEIPPVKLPEGFEAVLPNYVIKGYCPKCAGRQ